VRLDRFDGRRYGAFAHGRRISWRVRDAHRAIQSTFFRV
jgi:hypothetical protein